MPSACLKKPPNNPPFLFSCCSVLVSGAPLFLCALQQSSSHITTTKGSNELNSNSDTVQGLCAPDIITFYIM